MFGKDDADRTERGPRLSFSLGLLLVDLIAVILLSMFNYNVFYVESRDSYKENFVEYERNISRIAFDNIENQFISYMKIPDFYFASIPQNDSLLLPQREDIMGNAECVRALSDALYVIRSTYPYLYSMDIYYERTGTIVTGFGNIHQTVEKEKVAELCPWLEMMPEDSESCILPLSDNSYPTKEPVITYVRKITSAMWEGRSIYVALHTLPDIISDFISEDDAHVLSITGMDGTPIYTGYEDGLSGIIPEIGDTSESEVIINGDENIIFSYSFPETGLRYTYMINYSLFSQLNADQDRELLVLFLISIFLNILVLSGLTYMNYVIYKRHIHRFSENVGLTISREGVDASLSSMTAQIKNLHHTAESAKELRLINIVRGLVLSSNGEASYSQIYNNFPGSFVRSAVIKAEGREGDLMANMLNEQFREENTEGNGSVLCTFISPNNVVALIVVNEGLEHLDELTNKVIRLAGDLPVDIGSIMPLKENGFHESFVSAQDVARYRFLYSDQVLSYDTLKMGERKNSGIHSKYIDQMEKDLNAVQSEAFSFHLASLLDSLRYGDYTIQYILSVLSDLAIVVYSYMLRNQLDSWIVFGYDIREFAKRVYSIDDFSDWMNQTVLAIYRSIEERSENIDMDIKQQIELIISREIENDISLSMIADELGMKPYELSRTFTKIMGKNYIDYIKDRKLMKAVEFLREGMAVQDIAKRLGYRSPQYFIRIFKENFGTTPYQYRKTVLDAEDN